MACWMCLMSLFVIYQTVSKIMFVHILRDGRLIFSRWPIGFRYMPSLYSIFRFATHRTAAEVYLKNDEILIASVRNSEQGQMLYIYWWLISICSLTSRPILKCPFKWAFKLHFLCVNKHYRSLQNEQSIYKHYSSFLSPWDTAPSRKLPNISIAPWWKCV